ncbi:FtsK/SpoIIIE domain-containing protein [Mycobacteroides abscessus]|nr:FtsK/SpoIIIE domain-containing protein [Mycobacteroides abscessus]
MGTRSLERTKDETKSGVTITRSAAPTDITPPPVWHRIEFSVWAIVFPVLLIVVVGIFVYIGFKSGMFRGGMGMLMPGFMLLAVGGMMYRQVRGGGGGENKGPLSTLRRAFARYVDVLSGNALAAEEKQFIDLRHHYPNPKELLNHVGSNRMWERTPGNERFGKVRVGLGVIEPSFRFSPVDVKASEELEPASASALNNMLYARVDQRDVPREFSLKGQAGWSLTGDLDLARGGARAIAAHLEVFHAPDDVQLVTIVNDATAPLWDYLKWLPHHRHSVDGHDQFLSFRSADEFLAAMGDEYSERGQMPDKVQVKSGTTALTALASSVATTAPAPEQTETVERSRLIVVICDSDSVAWDSLIPSGGRGREGVCFLNITAEPTGPLAVPSKTFVYGRDKNADPIIRRRKTLDEPLDFMSTADFMTRGMAEAIAKRTCKWRLGSAAQRLLGGGGTASDSEMVDLALLLGITDAATFDPKVTQARARDPRNILRVPVGKHQFTAKTFIIDQKEPSENGHGPHMGHAGQTGWGKSEYARTKAIALAATHTTDDLLMIGCDLKGNVTFQGLEDLAHFITVLNNLDANADRVERFLQWFAGEIERRERLIKLAGPKIANIREYRAARAAGAKGIDGKPLPPFPYLLVMFDELAEAKSQYPLLVNFLTVVGRLGRSLGIHLDVLSQKLDPAALGAIATHLAGRLCFNMGDPSEYRELLGNYTAPDLPRRAGAAYYASSKDPKESVSIVQIAYAGAPYKRPKVQRTAAQVTTSADYYRPTLLSTLPDPVAQKIQASYPQRAVAPEPEEAPRAPDENEKRTVGEVLIRRLSTVGDRFPYPPELDQRIPINDVMETYQVPEEAEPEMFAPVGVIDRPRDEIKQPALYAPLHAGSFIVGRNGGERSSILAAIVLGAACRFSPERVQFYGLDFGGGTLKSLESLKHIGAVIQRGDNYGTRRLIAHLMTLINTRTEQWPAAGIYDVKQWREARFGENPTAPNDGHGEVYLVIDTLEGLFRQAPDLEGDLKTIADVGSEFGVHMIVTAKTYASDSVHKLEPSLPIKYELKLDDPAISRMARTLNEAIPAHIEGRGLVAEGYGAARRSNNMVGNDRIEPRTAWDILFAAPAVRDANNQVFTGPDACTAINITYAKNDAAPDLPKLPTSIPESDVAPQISPVLSLGLRELDLGVQTWDPRQRGHLYIPGLKDAGKSTLMRHIAHQLERHITENGDVVWIADKRRSLVMACPSAGKRYLTSEAKFPEMYEEIRQLVVPRMINEEDEEQEQIAARMAERDQRGLGGPRVWLLIENLTDWLPDKEGKPPFAQLADLIAQGKDIGFHIVLSRMADMDSMMGRGIHMPLLANGATTMFMSSAPDVQHPRKIKGQKLPAGRALMIDLDVDPMMVQAPLSPPDLPGQVN